MEYLVYAVVLLGIVIVSNVVCLIVGLYVGRSMVGGERIAMPNPIKKIQEHRIEVERQKEQEAVETMLHNIDVYDGTGAGQRDLPGR